MSDMLERAAHAVQDSDLAHAVPDDGTVEANDWRERESENAARAALLAALDPEDEALLSALAEAPTFSKLDWIDAKVIVGLIRDHILAGDVAADE